MAKHGGDQHGGDTLKIPLCFGKEALRLLWQAQTRPEDVFFFSLSEAAGMVVNFLVLELGTDLPGLLWLGFKRGWV